jgi:sugar lactone lactonase YvrE
MRHGSKGFAFLAVGVLGVTAAGPGAVGRAGGSDGPYNGGLSGRSALVALGDDISMVAARHGREVDEVVEMFETDPSVRLDHTGRIFFVDDFSHPDDDHDHDRDEHASSDATSRSATVATPLSESPPQAFTLHSRPGSKRVIHLDFDGHTVADTVWNGLPGFVRNRPAFDLDGNPAVFSVAERNVIIEVWQRVSEDFAPFDIDVTTEHTPLSLIERTGSGDQYYGTRALIGPSVPPNGQSYDPVCGGCAGIAYLGVFGLTSRHSHYQPTFVLTDRVNGADDIADVVSHEVGHNLGLQHDGNAVDGEYHRGTGDWGPIMGAPYTPLAQWSNGEYRDATNKEDDLAVIAANGGTPVRDDHGGTVATATPAGTAATIQASGVISTAQDVDVFSFTVATTSAVTIRVDPVSHGANLDIRAVLRRADATAVTAHDGVGLGACLVATLMPGTYVVQVEGVGQGDPFAVRPYGYTDAGSLGRYTVSSTPTCVPAPRFGEQFRGSVSGPGQLISPATVGVGPDGSVFVVEGSNGVVERFAANGTYLATLSGTLSWPNAVAVGSTGSVYVLDQFTRRVHVFDTSGVEISTFGHTGPNMLSSPTDVVIDPRNGTVLVADSGNSQVVRFDADGVRQSSFGSSGTGNGQFSDLRALSVDATGNIYAADQVWNGSSPASRLTKFTATGSFLWAASLVDPGDTYGSPSGVTTSDDGTVHVTDADRGLVVMLRASDGVRSGTWRREMRSGWRPADIQRGTNGDVWVVDTNSAVVERHLVRAMELVAPTVTLQEPAADATVAVGTRITARYMCSDPAGGSGLAFCLGSVPNGTQLDTTVPGTHTFRVTATDRDGNSTTSTRQITVASPRPDGRLRAQGARRWLGNNVYGYTSQYLLVRARPGRTAVCEVSLQNDAIVADRLAVRASIPRASGYTVTVVRADGTRVTKALKAGTYRTKSLAPGASEVLRVRVAIRRSPVPTVSQSVSLQISSATAEIGFDNVTCAAVPS